MGSHVRWPECEASVRQSWWSRRVLVGGWGAKPEGNREVRHREEGKNQSVLFLNLSLALRGAWEWLGDLLAQAWLGFGGQRRMGRDLENLGGALVERVGEVVLYKVHLTSLIMHFMGLAFTLSL